MENKEKTPAELSRLSSARLSSGSAQLRLSSTQAQLDLAQPNSAQAQLSSGSSREFPPHSYHRQMVLFI